MVHPRRRRMKEEEEYSLSEVEMASLRMSIKTVLSIVVLSFSRLPWGDINGAREGQTVHVW